jgi:hypothetical protein
MKVEFQDGRTTVSTGRSGDYDCTGINVSVWDFGAPERHTVELQGFGKRGNLVKGDLSIPVADAPALIQTLQDMLANYHHSQELKALV